ncbi:IS701 family transposase [Rhodocaloribacter sp.]
MNLPKCDELDYIHFLIAAQKVFTCTEAARCQPQAGSEAAPAHDAFTRLLQRRPPETEALWQEAQAFIEKETGVLVLDDTTLDKPYAQKMDLVTRHWSGKHKRVVRGINLLTLLWRNRVVPSSEAAHIPCDFRLYDKPFGGKTKNEHFRDMLEEAKKRGFVPQYVVFDSWYSGLENLKAVRAHSWCFFTRLKSNRLVNPDDTYNRAISEVEIADQGRVVHLKGFGFVRVFRTVNRDGDAEHWATNDLALSEGAREELARLSWGIETYHRQVKQYCGIERSQCRSARAQRNHILLSLRAYLRLEVHRLREAVSFYESKLSIMREAVRQYLADPTYILAPTA